MANYDNGQTRKRKTEANKALYIRLMDVLEECRVSRTAQFGVKNGVSRRWLAERVGCDARTLSNSPRLTGYVRRWERWNLATIVDINPRNGSNSALNEGSNELADTSVVPFRTLDDEGRIVKAPYRKNRTLIVPIPTLIWRDGIDAEVSDYSRHLILRNHLADSSVEEFVKVLRIFTRYRRSLGLSWQRVDDDIFLGWQTHMLGADIPVTRRNYCLTVVHAFYRWAEYTGRIKYHVRLGRLSDYPKDMYDYQFPISSIEIKSTKSRRSYVSWQTPLTEKIGHGGYGFRHTPNTEQIYKLFALVQQTGEHGVRNHLMMSWALECGARLHELLQPTLDDLPNTSQLREVMQTDCWVVRVKRKGQKGKDGRLILSADLILRTLDYVRHERKLVVEKCKAAGKEPSNHVFISARTGHVLNNDSVTRICGKIFKAAKVGRANIHRLRAAYITQEVERCLIAVEAGGHSVDTTSTWHETVLTIAAQLMGHTSILSLRPYLNHLLIRRLQTKEYLKNALEPTDVEKKQMAHEFARENAELVRAMSLRVQGKFKEAADILDKQGQASKRLAENQVAFAA
jgi:integrase